MASSPGLPCPGLAGTLRAAHAADLQRQQAAFEEERARLEEQLELLLPWRCFLSSTRLGWLGGGGLKATCVQGRRRGGVRGLDTGSGSKVAARRWDTGWIGRRGTRA